MPAGDIGDGMPHEDIGGGMHDMGGMHIGGAGADNLGAALLTVQPRAHPASMPGAIATPMSANSFEQKSIEYAVGCVLVQMTLSFFDGFGGERRDAAR